jgi:hypothetical protein
MSEPWPSCPVCSDPVLRIRLEDGLRYHDVWFDTARYGSFEELGAAERWETVWFDPEFDRVVNEPCGHSARGPRGVHWLLHLRQHMDVPPATPTGDVTVAIETDRSVPVNLHWPVPADPAGNAGAAHFVDTRQLPATTG